MIPCLFVSDLHGRMDRYRKLLTAIRAEEPTGVFLGGDLLPHGRSGATTDEDFVLGPLTGGFRRLREEMKERYPEVFLILGNDDERSAEAAILDAATEGLWRYAHDHSLPFGRYTVYGYSYTNPTPFRLKDWERYDVDRHVPPGCMSPEAGRRTVPVCPREVRDSTIQADLESLASGDAMSHAVFLFHCPPSRTQLDRAALDGATEDGKPLDVHVGSVAIRGFIEGRQPLVTLHGHIHESARLTGAWRDRLGRTEMFSAAHDGPELALVRFDLEDPAAASRELL